jgi:hypothetical protein
MFNNLLVAFGKDVVWIVLEFVVEFLHGFGLIVEVYLWLLEEAFIDFIIGGVEFKSRDQFLHHLVNGMPAEVPGRP